MPHIHTQDNQHDLTVTVYVVRVDTAEPRVLLHMHRKLKMLLPVGGHVELLETPWQAVAHELREESGYELDQLEVLQPRSRIKTMTGVAQHPYPLSMNTHSMPGQHFHTDVEYALVAKEDPRLPVVEGESTDLRWLSYDELTALSNSLIYDNTREVYQFVLKGALENWQVVSAKDFILDYPDKYLDKSPIFTQKWAIIALLEDVPDGAEFYHTDFPLHITLAGVFSINKTGQWLAQGLNNLLADQTMFDVQAGKKDMFGPNKDVAVMRIIKSPELLSMYGKIHKWLLGSGATYNEPKYQGDGYLPHSTFQKAGVLNVKEVRQIKSVSIIDLFPNSDGYQRKVFKTIKLK